METINALAQLIAAIGVIASLFYLSVQIRQNTLSQRAAVVDSLAHSLIDLIAPQAYDPKVGRSLSVVVEDWHAATEEDRLRAVHLLFAEFKLFENAWFQKRHGTLEPQQWKGWDRYIRLYYHRPGVKTWWSMRREAFAPGFVDYLEATQPVPGLRTLEQLIRGEP